ncbi:substrate-binding periplasmic protein [Hahella ganghwensis]|uniref:substrate-binding periplasmic protein n=1 Tax=Hahella ganghwensis TaxID=286420 RepID=UPI000367D866|nr:transporter substrate-binding domain-containing protein [Hahella ganghwensis]
MRMLSLVFLLWWSQCTIATTLVVGMEEANNAPFEYIDDNVQLTGFHVEVVREVAKRLGWTLQFQRHPWKWAIRALENGEFHAVTYVAKSTDREKFAVFHPDNLLHISRTTLYIRKTDADTIVYTPPLQYMVRSWRTAMPGGYYMNDEIIRLLKNGAPIEQPTVTQNQLFVMLISGRYDAIFGATSAIKRAREEIANIDAQIQRLEGAVFEGKRMYIAFSRQIESHLTTDFAEAYRQFRDEAAYQNLGARFGIGELMPLAHEFH